MNEYWFQTRARSSPRPVIVLDVSNAAAPLWPVLQSTVEGLGEILPAQARPDVAFLGGSERISLDKFIQQADSLYASNQGRGRVISPLLDSFRNSWPGRVVIIAVQPIVDLADWKLNSNAKRMAIVRMDSSTSISGGAFPEAELTDLEAVAKLVHQAPVGIRIRVPGAMPFTWDNPAYRFVEGRIEADPGAGADVRVGFLSNREEAVAIAELVRAEGMLDRLPIEAIETPSEPAWVPFTSAELTWLHAWQSGREAHCPSCGLDHAPGVLKCPEGDGKLMSSFDKLTPGSFVRVRVKMFQGSFQPTNCPALAIDDSTVVIQKNTEPFLVVWKYDAGADEWRETSDKWGRFERLGPDEEFAIALPPSPVEDAK